jgi:hypothetical protein
VRELSNERIAYVSTGAGGDEARVTLDHAASAPRAEVAIGDDELHIRG